MARSRHFYEFIMHLWPLSKVAFRLGKLPLLGSLIRPFFSSHVNRAVIIPVNEDVRVSNSAPLPYTLLAPLVKEASSRFIMDTCLCRGNEGCSRFPHDIGCLYLGQGALEINPSLGHAASVEEALEHIQNAMDIKLVPMIAHTLFDAYLHGIPYRRMLVVCFCCDCCCAIRNGMRMGPPAFWDLVVRLPGLQVQINDDCIGCGVCLGECPVQAIEMAGSQAVIGGHCKGCGCCADICPVGAVELILPVENNTLEELKTKFESRTSIH